MSDDKLHWQDRELTLQEAPLKWVLNIRDLPDEGRTGELVADQNTLQALSEWLGEDPDFAVQSLLCRYKIKPGATTQNDQRATCFEGEFHLSARLRQRCVITLEPMETQVEDVFFQDFADGPMSNKRGQDSASHEPIEDLFAKDPPLSVQNAKIELGPLIYQIFSMAIDPHPRKETARYEDQQAFGGDEGGKAASPFAVLKGVKIKN